MSEFKDSSRARARSIVRFSILPTIAAAFKTHPEFDVAEVLRVCETALTDTLAHEFADRANSSPASPEWSGLSPMIGVRP
jgi:hypothetical protein